MPTARILGAGFSAVPAVTGPAPSSSPPSPLIRGAGALAVGFLRGLGSIPVELALALLTPGLLPYRLLRRRHVARLRACFAASPFGDRLSLPVYYRRRLALLLSGLRAHGRPVTAAFPRVETEGAGIYADALASGRPVVLLGLHAGPWELLHRLPASPADRPFAIATAPAFAPALTAFMAEGREREGKRILWTGDVSAKGLLTGLREVLDAKGILALMTDQVPGPAQSSEYLELWSRIRCPYPGRLLHFLEERDCLFVPVSVRMAEGIAKLRYHGAWEAAGPDRVRAFLEESIAAAPDQWNWSYPKITPRVPAES
jgi:lauroyl/myristoyl acyltransferase